MFSRAKSVNSFLRNCFPLGRFHRERTFCAQTKPELSHSVKSAASSLNSILLLSISLSSFSYGLYHVYDLFWNVPEPVTLMWNSVKDDEKTIDLFGPNPKKWPIWHGFVDGDIASIKIFVTGRNGESGVIRGEYAKTKKTGWEVVSLHAFRTDSKEEVTNVDIADRRKIVMQSMGLTTGSATCPIDAAELREKYSDDIIAALAGYSVDAPSNENTSVSACPNVKQDSTLTKKEEPTAAKCPLGHK